MTNLQRTTSLLASVLLAALPLAGCREAPSAAGLKQEIERQLPGLRLASESHVRLGRFTLGVAKKIIRWASDEDDEDLRILRHVKRVHVATYRVVSLPEAGELELPSRFERRLAEQGWETLVRQREDDEQSWVLYRAGSGGAIRNLYVVDLDEHELTVVDVAGRLDRVIAEALADDPRDVTEIFGA